MRIVLCLLAIPATLIAVATTRSDEPAKAAAPATRAKANVGDALEHHYTVHCRWIGNAGDDRLLFPVVTVADEKKETISNIGKRPFVTGVWRWTDPDTKNLDRQPHISVIDEGVKIELVVAGWPPEGATVDATVEFSTIGDVPIKTIIPESDHYEKQMIQVPSVEIAKKRIVDFVKFGEPFIVPLGEKRADGTTRRVEIIVDAPKDK